MRIKVEPFLMKQGNRVGKAAVEFTDGILAGFHLVGFTICDDAQGMYVLFPASMGNKKDGEQQRTYFFLRPNGEGLLDKLQDAILDVYESMLADRAFNRPRIKQNTASPSVASPVS